VTFHDIRKIALAWSGVEDGTSYGTPALKVRKKLLVRPKRTATASSCPAFRLRSASCAGNCGGRKSRCWQRPPAAKPSAAPDDTDDLRQQTRRESCVCFGGQVNAIRLRRQAGDVRYG
jgi:hypothetical protein